LRHYRIAPGKASTPVGKFPGIESPKRRVLLFPRMPKTEVVGYVSLSERHGTSNGLGTAQEGWSGIAAPTSDMPPPLRWALSRSQPPFLRPSTTEACQKLRGARRRCRVSHPAWKAGYLSAIDTRHTHQGTTGALCITPPPALECCQSKDVTGLTWGES
jgi:hypothetical protein